MFDLERRIRSTAEALDRLKTGALVSFTGGATVLGTVAHGVFWIPSAMAGALLVYRCLAGYITFRQGRQKSRLALWDDVRERMQDLHQSELPPEQVQLLSRALESELPIAATRERLLASPSPGNENEGDVSVARESKS